MLPIVQEEKVLSSKTVILRFPVQFFTNMEETQTTVKKVYQPLVTLCNWYCYTSTRSRPTQPDTITTLWNRSGNHKQQDTVINNPGIERSRAILWLRLCSELARIPELSQNWARWAKNFLFRLQTFICLGV